MVTVLATGFLARHAFGGGGPRARWAGLNDDGQKHLHGRASLWGMQGRGIPLFEAPGLGWGKMMTLPGPASLCVRVG